MSRQYLVSGHLYFVGRDPVPLSGTAITEPDEIMNFATLCRVEAILLKEAQVMAEEAGRDWPKTFRISTFQPFEVPVAKFPEYRDPTEPPKLSLPETLPPVGCPILIELSGVLVPCERVDHLRHREDQMTYRLTDSQVIEGRFNWTYP